MPFRPALIPTVASAGALVVLLNLSAWQYRRHTASEADRARIHVNLDAPPASAADLAAPPESLAWRKATLTGHFDDADAALVTGRYEFGEQGYEVVVPFHVDGAGVILVSRGWIPDAGWDAALSTIHTHGAPTTVDGLLLNIQGSPDVKQLPAAQGHPARWPMELRRFAGCEVGLIGEPYAAIAAAVRPEAKLVLVAGPAMVRGQVKPREPLPVSGYIPEPKEIGHLSYSAQWGMIALTLVGIWTYAGFRRGALTAATPPDGAPPPAR